MSQIALVVVRVVARTTCQSLAPGEPYGGIEGGDPHYLSTAGVRRAIRRF